MGWFSNNCNEALKISNLNVEKCDKANNENLEDARKYKFENENLKSEKNLCDQELISILPEIITLKTENENFKKKNDTLFKDNTKCNNERKKLQSRLADYSLEYKSLNTITNQYKKELDKIKNSFGKKIPLGNISFESDIIYLKKIIC